MKKSEDYLHIYNFVLYYKYGVEKVLTWWSGCRQMGLSVSSPELEDKEHMDIAQADKETDRLKSLRWHLR